MENMINKILDMDKKARAMEAEAEEHRNHFQLEIDRRKQELYNQYAKSLIEIIEMTEAEQAKMREQGKRQLDEEADGTLQQMEQTYRQNADNWVAHITKEVIGNA